MIKQKVVFFGVVLRFRQHLMASARLSKCMTAQIIGHSSNVFKFPDQNGMPLRFYRIFRHSSTDSRKIREL